MLQVMSSELDGPQRRPSFDGSNDGPALVVDHLTKHFGERVASADVSFEVGYGEVFGFLARTVQARRRPCGRSGP